MTGKLTRSIGLTQATAMVVGTIVGSSIFVQPSEVSRAVPNFSGMLLVWIAAGALTWFGASICAELASAMPRTGGVYVFLREMFSPAAGFLWGWAMFWSMHSGIVAAIAVVVGRYAGFFVSVDERAVAVGAIATFSLINYIGVRQGSAVQTFFTIVKVAGIIALLVLLVGARVYYAMAQDGLLFRWFGAVHPRFQTPHRAIVLQAVWSWALVVTGTYRELFTRVVYTEWIFFALMTAGLFRLRLRTWGHPIVPLVFIGATSIIVITQIVATPIESLTGLMIVLAGLPVYWLWTSARRAAPPR